MGIRRILFSVHSRHCCHAHSAYARVVSLFVCYFVVGMTMCKRRMLDALLLHSRHGSGCHAYWCACVVWLVYCCCYGHVPSQATRWLHTEVLGQPFLVFDGCAQYLTSPWAPAMVQAAVGPDVRFMACAATSTSSWVHFSRFPPVPPHHPHAHRATCATYWHLVLLFRPAVRRFSHTVTLPLTHAHPLPFSLPPLSLSARTHNILSLTRTPI